MATETQSSPRWSLKTIGELEAGGVIAEIQDGNHGERHPKSTDYAPAGIPFVMAKDLKHGRVDLSQCSFIPKSLADSMRVGFAKSGDVLLTHKATMGRVAVVPSICDYLMLTPQVTYYRVGDPDRLSNSYLKYAFMSPDFQQQLNSDSDQSTRRYIGVTAQRRLMVPFPSIAKQRAIVRVLESLDERIDLNWRMNETLETIAHALFKSWFVDFDPVHANLEGRKTVLPEKLAKMFPHSLERSEAGEIPKGWLLLSLDEIARFLNGLPMQRFPPKDGQTLPVVKIAQLRAGNTEEADRADSNLPERYVVEDGDVLFSWSGSLECVLWAGGRGALNQHLFKVTSDLYPRWLYYLWIHQHLPEFRRVAASKATTMGHIQRRHLTDAKVILPPAPLLQEMDSYIGPLIEAGLQRRLQSKTLAAIRDALLPKLISGELRLGHIERLVSGREPADIRASSGLMPDGQQA